jgi:hypothetical protein
VGGGGGAEREGTGLTPWPISSYRVPVVCLYTSCMHGGVLRVFAGDDLHAADILGSYRGVAGLA